ncbi:dTDP-glucose 4,6-dehydratase [Bacillus sp. ISL-35]|uniref:dTDP-glucose 4,6-dehydratase n=1 Tax=Bacillus sp. ISL-35 TaxID=2819122 RepID=UPI001BEAD7EB|nr:dTDP-glucose 4,6-dehydratase [Bacillus sp. ISL-35]MBT2678838.1 dTDP-glucose 4,6-dehydratase [Bacillus sp. ISL-35]MBT2703830.1 dTDP-glucose 4,6-dehydratase [Chryseobacterium sp. ISL-80]
MNLIVTGGAGFIGSNFVRHILTTYPEYKVVNLDLLTYAGNIHNLDDLKDNPNHVFVKGNITDRELVVGLIKEHNIDAIINFAAESHVDRSILNPGVFVETNVQGTLALLEAAKETGIQKYLQVSTDEVYGSLGETGYFTEETPLAPNSPYSASKAGADMLVRSYHETYGMNVNITRCSNNYGPYHFPEKLIPLMITNGLDGEELPIYGDGKNVRDWLHVKDHCSAIDLVLHEGKPGEVYNVGGHNERTNNEIVEIIVEKLKLSRDKIKYVEDRLGHDRRYAIDPQKIQNELGWKPKYTFETGIVETIDWYLNNEAWWRPLKERAKLEK